MVKRRSSVGCESVGGGKPAEEICTPNAEGINHKQADETTKKEGTQHATVRNARIHNLFCVVVIVSGVVDLNGFLS